MMLLLLLATFAVITALMVIEHLKSHRICPWETRDLIFELGQAWDAHEKWRDEFFEDIGDQAEDKPQIERHKGGKAPKPPRQRRYRTPKPPKIEEPPAPAAPQAAETPSLVGQAEDDAAAQQMEKRSRNQYVVGASDDGEDDDEFGKRLKLG